MGKKLTYQEVYDYIQINGNTLLDLEYINDHTKLNIKCPVGHIFPIILNSFKNGRRCPTCKGLDATKRQRTPYETILKRVEDLGRKLLTTKQEYEDNYSKENKFFFIECVCGNPHKTALDRLKKKCLCKKCANKKTGDRSRTPFQKILSVVESKNWTLLSKEESYKNSETILDLICDKDHYFSATYIDLRRKNSGCPECIGQKRSSHMRVPYNDLVETAALNHLTILMPENEYNKNFRGVSKKIPMVCDICEHLFTTSPGRINMDFGCQPCGVKRSSDKRRRTHAEVAEIIQKMGYSLVSKEYSKCLEKLEICCPKHGNFFSMLGDLVGGHRCRKCSHTSPKAQQDLFKFIKDFYPDAVDDTRRIIKPYELDIYIPSLSLAIEYNGLYWHSEEYKQKNDHIHKMKLCNEKGIRLITIFEDEWLKRQDQVKNFLLSVIGKNDHKIMGRKTDLRVVLKSEAVAFLKANHIQGSSAFEVAFGLYHEDELQGVVTGNKHHRQGHSKVFVLNRLAFKSSTSISGGSSKLLKVLLGYARENGYERLISWSDNRWSEGNVYKSLGFALTEELGPDYSYVHKDSRISKQSCRKSNLAKRGGKGNTEKDMALSLDLYRIWDCGKKRWEIIL